MRPYTTVQGVRVVPVTSRTTHAEALAEACRRLRVMNEKWPQIPWRMRVHRRRHEGNSRWWVWAVDCLFPDELRQQVTRDLRGHRVGRGAA